MSVTTRLATVADWPLIQRFHCEQNGAQGTHTALPQLFGDHGNFASNIALVFINERNGVPVQSFWYILVPELCFAGTDAEATAHARREAEPNAFLLRSMGFTGTNCKVPEHMAESIRSPLEKAGYSEDLGFTHFFKDLRLPAQEDEETDH